MNTLDAIARDDKYAENSKDSIYTISTRADSPVVRINKEALMLLIQIEEKSADETA